MDALRILNRLIGIAGALIVCITFYMTRKDATQHMFTSFCVDAQGRLYSLGGHQKPDPNGMLEECTPQGWADTATAACEQMNTKVEVDTGKVLSSEN